jgi:hypothetical protein
MDAVWHAAILDTELYAKIQQQLGMMLHHSPGGAASDPASSAARERRLTTMRQQYAALYSAQPVEDENDVAIKEAPAPVSASRPRRVSVIPAALANFAPFARSPPLYVPYVRTRMVRQTIQNAAASPWASCCCCIIAHRPLRHYAPLYVTGYDRIACQTICMLSRTACCSHGTFS